jgi:hypothetical protein
MSRWDKKIFVGVGKRDRKRCQKNCSHINSNCAGKLLRLVEIYLTKHEIEFDYKSWAEFAPILEKLAGLKRPEKGAAFSSDRGRVLKASIILGIVETPPAAEHTVHEILMDGVTLPPAEKSKFAKTVPNRPPRRKKEKDKFYKFYHSYEWHRLRYSVLKEYGRKCMCCGETTGTMHVDHIKPLRQHWELRLDRSNLQVLCDDCNHGKGNWDTTDFRPKVSIPRFRIVK